ncbi:MAG TPA: ABC transporter ATP-binding protein [Gemmatimonadaceae bacterium]|nr:ABC transporter ATP-binding protein [Gemmatimonadaceae bacterium]
MSSGERRYSEQAAKPAQDPARLSDGVITRRVLRETKGFRLRILCVFFLGLLATPVALLTPVPLAIVVDNVLGSEPPPSFVSAVLPGWIESSSTQMLVVACVLLVAVAVLGNVQSTAQTVTELVTGERMTLRVQAKLLANAQRQSFAFHDKRGTADAIYRIQKDASAMQALVFSGFIPITSAAFTLVSMIYIVVRIDPELALIALLISPLLFFSAHQYKVRMRPRYTETKELESSAGHVIQEVLTSFRVVKAFGRESAEEARFHHHSMRGLQARVGLALAENIYSIIVTLTTAMGSAVVLFVGVRNVQAGTLSLGELLIVVGYISQLYGPLKTLSKSLSGLQNQFASTERAFQLLDEVPDVVERPNARSIGRSLGRIEFDNVTFGYDAKSPVLQSVTATVPAGSSLGVMGRTGSGKTTLVSLLPRFYDPTQGHITLDGVDIRDYKLADLRRQFAIVLQDPLLFATSIADNIAYARPDASEEDLVRAAQAAGAHEFISQLPDGYQTKVGERGMRLSGGERQRISIARAFLADAPILILDEPTSSVDVTTEAGIMETMTQLMEGRTTIMIAHRLSTLGRCDLLVKVEDGAVSRCNSSADEPNVSLVSHDAAPNRRRWMSHVRRP